MEGHGIVMKYNIPDKSRDLKDYKLYVFIQFYIFSNKNFDN